jgi:hypothetical protein
MKIDMKSHSSLCALCMRLLNVLRSAMVALNSDGDVVELETLVCGLEPAME